MEGSISIGHTLNIWAYIDYFVITHKEKKLNGSL